jgi:hypothetical protein
MMVDGVFDPWSPSAREPQDLDHDGRVRGPCVPATALPALWVLGVAWESLLPMGFTDVAEPIL